MKCLQCEKEFLAMSGRRLFCTRECAKAYRNKIEREARARDRAFRDNAKAAKRPVKTKTLADWCREADECNMDYGNYRAQIEVFGKTFEELKAQASSSYAGARSRHLVK